MAKTEVFKNTGSVPITSDFTDQIFSSTDIVAYVTLPSNKHYTLGTLNLLTISTHRDKFPVSSVGKIGMKGFTYGHRVVGGTMIFASLDRSVWQELIEAAGFNKGKAQSLNPYLSVNNSLEEILPDMLPPFDVGVTFVNNNGWISYTGIKGVTILDEGENYSINNISIMESYSYMAIDRIPFQSYDLSTGATSMLNGVTEYSGTFNSNIMG